MTEDDERFLRSEFDGEERSFLVRLHAHAHWDHERFGRLVAAIERCADEYSGAESLPRWLAAGVWWLNVSVPHLVAHLRRSHGPEFFADRCQALDAAADAFFNGRPAPGGD